MTSSWLRIKFSMTAGTVSLVHGPSRRPDTDDGAISSPQGRGRRCFALLPDGRLLRIVLRRRQGRRRLPRHRAHQAREKRRRGDPDVRRSRPFGRKLPRPADQGRQPGGDRRAGRKPGRGAKGARIEGAGPARDRPAGHPGNSDRGNVARRRLGQLACRGRPRGRRMGDRRRRHFHRAFRAGRLRPRRPRLGAGPAGTGRDPSRRQGAGDRDPGGQRRLRQRGGRAGAQEPLRPGDARRARRAVPGRAGRRRRAARLPRLRRRRAPACCSTRRGGSPARRTCRSTLRPARAWS